MGPDPSDSGSLSRRDHFVALYEANHDHLYAYLHRRLAGTESDVCDVLADVFTVAWRRLDVLPPPPEDRLWLYGVAHRVLLRDRRSRVRRARLRSRLMGEALRPTTSGASTDLLHLQIRAAMDRLRPRDREVLRLVLWERLSHAETAQVLGCSVNAVALRLHRAKARMRADLGFDPHPSSATHLISPDATRS